MIASYSVKYRHSSVPAGGASFRRYPYRLDRRTEPPPTSRTGPLVSTTGPAPVQRVVPAVSISRFTRRSDAGGGARSVGPANPTYASYATMRCLTCCSITAYDLCPKPALVSSGVKVHLEVSSVVGECLWAGSCCVWGDDRRRDRLRASRYAALPPARCRIPGRVSLRASRYAALPAS
jgi:hypothetical protein